MVKSTLLVEEVRDERAKWSTIGRGGFCLSARTQTKGMWPDGNAIEHASCTRGSGLTKSEKTHRQNIAARGKSAALVTCIRFRDWQGVCGFLLGFFFFVVCAFKRSSLHWSEQICVSTLPGSSTGLHPRISGSQMVSLVTTGQLSAG